MLRDTLAAFAHIELGLEGDFLLDTGLDDASDYDAFLAAAGSQDDSPQLNEDAIAAALDDALGNQDVIDRYIAANAGAFGKADLAIVESWKAALMLRALSRERGH